MKTKIGIGGPLEYVVSHEGGAATLYSEHDVLAVIAMSLRKGLRTIRIERQGKPEEFVEIDVEMEKNETAHS